MKIKKIYIAGIIILFILAVFLFSRTKEPVYQFKENKMYYSQNREKPDFNIFLNYTNDSTEVYSVNFKSRDFLNYSTTIYGLVFVPRNKENVPGLVLLPGGGGTKEQESTLAMKIAKLGYAVITIDQRGVGQTGGYYLSPEQDYSFFTKGNEPIQHLSVYDALRSYDVLKEIKNVDKNNIGIAGESMGGRYAIIAAALDNSLKGAIIISSSGFHIQNDGKVYTPYLLSIDPDNYIKDISPNHLFMLHGSNDTVVPLKEAETTFSLAKEPKKFFIAENCNHGYCDKMYYELKSDLEVLFEK